MDSVTDSPSFICGRSLGLERSVEVRPGRWSIAGITSFQSGTPFTVLNGSDGDNDHNE
jgi:hypothetical protein